jgi:hypothetical protein
MKTADKAKHCCPIRLIGKALEKGTDYVWVVQVIEEITGEKEEAWTQGIGLCSQILLGESVLHEGMEDRIAFALVDSNLAAYICQVHFEFGAFGEAQQNSRRLLNRWNDGFVCGLVLLTVSLTILPYIHEKSPQGLVFENLNYIIFTSLLTVPGGRVSLREKDKVLLLITQLFQQRKDISFVGGGRRNGFRGISSEMLLCCMVCLPKGFCLARGIDDSAHLPNQPPIFKCNYPLCIQ